MNTPVANGYTYGETATMLPAGVVARSLGVCRKTVNRWCASGVFLGAIRTEGGHWRIPRAALERRKASEPQQRAAA